MTPYGIVYKENPFALRKSLKFWQKKYGILKFSSLLRVNLFFLVYIAVISLILWFVFKNKEGFDSSISIFSTVLLVLLTVVFSVFMAKNLFVNQPANNIMKRKKQAVLYENEISFGTENGRSVFTYSDILICIEEFDILTIMVDEGSVPVSIAKNDVEKGDFAVFSAILKEKLSSRYVVKGGKRI